MTPGWRPVVGYEGVYEVSSSGVVRRVLAAGAAYPMKPALNPRKYLSVILRHQNTRSNRTIHSIVAAAFIGPRPVGLEINHKDGNKFNNDVSNLEYVTHQENCAHAYRTGLRTGTPGKREPRPEHVAAKTRGEKNPAAKLTTAQVRDIRQAVHIKTRDLASMYGVAVCTINRIKQGSKWRDVK